MVTHETVWYEQVKIPIDRAEIKQYVKMYRLLPKQEQERITVSEYVFCYWLRDRYHGF